MRINYLKGMKYSLIFPATIIVPVSFPVIYGDDYWISGYKVHAEHHFPWDGCSGLTWDDETNAKCGLVHDILYRALRNHPEVFIQFTRRDRKDYLLATEDGRMAYPPSKLTDAEILEYWRWQADLCLKAVFEESAAKSKNWFLRKAGPIRAWYYYHMLRRIPAAKASADPRNKMKCFEGL